MPSVLKALGKGRARPHEKVSIVAPVLPALEQVAGERERAWICLETVSNPLPQRVLLGEIVLGRLTDAVWNHEPALFPFHIPLDHPAQNRGPLSLELLSQVGISISHRNRHRERHQDEAPAYGLVDVAQARLRVARDQQLVRWSEVEEVAAHEASGQTIATGQGLHLRLVPRSSFRGLMRN